MYIVWEETHQIIQRIFLENDLFSSAGLDDYYFNNIIFHVEQDNVL